MKKKNVLFMSVALLLCSSLVLLAGCSREAGGNLSDKTTISISGWPPNTSVDELAAYELMHDTMNQKHPDIEIVRDRWTYDIRTFLPKANSNQLPTLYSTWFTEVNKIISADYAADLTEHMKEYGYMDAMNPEVLELVTKDGKIYGIPYDGYAQGLSANKNLFREAGLMREDGTVAFPSTYQELAETAKIIKEKTGKAGFGIPTMGNYGGWYFMNIAWSFGTEFMREENGKWISTFNTPECIAALQYVKDLQWKYNVLPENAFADNAELDKLFATDQLAMTFTVPPADGLIRDYEMNLDVLSLGRMPEGPAGRYCQMGGNVLMMAPNSTAEQIDAAFKWLEVRGITPKVTDEIKTMWENDTLARKEEGLFVLSEIPFKIWTNGPRMDAEMQIKGKYTNSNPLDFKEYYDFEDVIIRPEEPMACQELYSILDACIQAVITDENSDVAAIVAKAASDFQLNHLDKL